MTGEKAEYFKMLGTMTVEQLRALAFKFYCKDMFEAVDELVDYIHERRMNEMKAQEL